MLFQQENSAVLLPPTIDYSIEQQALTCIFQIINDYYKTDLPLVIQTPSTWGKYSKSLTPLNTKIHFGDILLGMLNSDRYVSQIVLGYVHDFKIRQLRNAFKPGFHIMLLSGANYVEELRMGFCMMYRLHKNSRNSASKALIISTLPMESSEIRRKAAITIITMLWSICSQAKVIVLIPIKIKQIYDNTLYNFDIYSWFPEEHLNLCSGKVSDVKLVNRWISKENKFNSNIELFPKEEVKDMKGCILSATMYEMYPFFYRDENKKLQGALLKLLQIAADKSNFKIKLVTTDEHRHITLPNIITQQAMTDECMYLYPHFKDQLAWFIPSGELIPRWQSLIKVPFNSFMWIMVISTFLTSSLMFWLLSKFPKYLKKNCIEMNLVLTIMNLFLTQLAMGITNRFRGLIPMTLFILWLFYCLQINALYQSALIGFLANPGEIPPLRSIKELNESTLKKMSIIKFKAFKGNYLLKYNIYGHCEPATECFSRVAQHRDMALLSFKAVGELSMREHFTEYGRPQFLALVEYVDTIYAGIVITQLGCVLYNRMEDIQSRLVSAGFVNSLVNDEVEKSLRTYFKSVGKEGAFVLTLSHLQGAFYISIIGIILSLIVFTSEIIYHKLNTVTEL
ncbi:Ionotropic receptor 429 [Blattella germanica]|nr:Ionotropic receptor 429 [Blattella germanica]